MRVFDEKSFNGINTCDVMRRARLDAGLSCKELAEKINCWPLTLEVYEKGGNEPPVSVFLAVMDICKASIWALYGCEEDGPDVVRSGLQEMVSTYNKLDASGKDLVRMVLEHERKRVTGSKSDSVKTLNLGETCPHCGKLMTWSEFQSDWVCSHCGYEGTVPEDPLDYVLPK